MKRALQIILAISLFGVAFSGYLSYGEVFGARATVSRAGRSRHGVRVSRLHLRVLHVPDHRDHIRRRAHARPRP